MPKIEQQKRENDILLGFLERPALQWLAEHAPAWVTSDILTYLGIVASVLIFISYSLTNISPNFLWLASLGFVLNWLGDSLDGTLARYRHLERPRYGFLVDHWIDAMSTVLIFLGLGLSPYVDFTAASLGAIMYLLLSIMVYLITYVTGVFQITSAKVGPTEIRVLAVILNTVIFFVGNPLLTLPYVGEISFYTLIVAILTVVMAIYFLVNTSIQVHRLKLLDEKRLERKIAKRESEKKSKKNNTPATAAS
jgi:phosphatidylglycerophosphate synthase